ncbi:Mitogen-activated protein kinase 14B [Hypsizygus marmoreus]|uniref:Mitogen-activated protein kinase 14B n=1 Tax=Hypsizygus marmoreus TaxID=39966 RepID=A0A369J5U1_HYPMA|nr:Mitogen-activated protein kinase 14B [Hypsizygus marmoreus]
MQPDDYAGLENEVKLLFDYNPPALSPHPKSPCPKLTAPLSFYDKHLDARLMLNKVSLNSAMINGLSQTVSLAIHSLRDQNILLPTIKAGDGFPTSALRAYRTATGPVVDAQAVARVYLEGTSLFCSLLASMLSLYGHATEWTSVLRFVDLAATRIQDYYSLNEDFGLTLMAEKDGTLKIPGNVWESMEDVMREDLKHVQRLFPRLAIWHTLYVSQDAEDALRDTGKLTSTESFSHERFHTLGYVVPDFTLPHSPDATKTSWGVPVISFVGSPTSAARPSPVTAEKIQPQAPVLRRSTRVRAKTLIRRRKLPPKPFRQDTPRREPSSPSKSDRIWAPTTPSPPESIKKVDDSKQHLAASLLQHAWSRAVQEDSTFMVFHCGNYERIAFRHRSSQTLHISDLIDVTKCADPSYGTLHIGLYMAIIEDALDRAHQLAEREKNAVPKIKRKMRINESESLQFRKRPKTRAVVAKEAALKLEREKAFEAVVRESHSRNLAILRIRYAHFNSEAPASFLRVNSVRETTYTPKEYLSITITSEIAAGAAGDVHAATLELLASNGEAVHYDVVVKLAFEPEQQTRMRHEFAVYQHLISSGVKGIPHIFGLFQDAESDALMLVMTNVGLCVWDRRPDKRTAKFTISKSEGNAFIDVLKSIHRAGVRHRDLRPENLAISDDGEVTIFDFDRAVLGASEGSRQRELEHLMDLVNGEYCPPGEAPSLGTPSEERYQHSPDDADPSYQFRGRVLRSWPSSYSLLNSRPIFVSVLL